MKDSDDAGGPQNYGKMLGTNTAVHVPGKAFDVQLHCFGFWIIVRPLGYEQFQLNNTSKAGEVISAGTVPCV